MVKMSTLSIVIANEVKQSHGNKTKGSLTLFGMTLRVRLLRSLHSLAMTYEKILKIIKNILPYHSPAQNLIILIKNH